MKLSARKYLLCVSLLWLCATSLAAQVFPSSEGERMRYTAYIEMPKAYLSGICILWHDGDVVKGSLFNEFGVTALDFTYYMYKEKVKLHDVMAQMNKWYIRRVLKKDLQQLMLQLQQGKTTYENQRQHIKYQLTPIAHETEE